MSDPAQAMQALERIVLYHSRLPGLEASKAQSFAHHILTAYENSRLAAGVSPDVIRIGETEKHLRRALAELEEMSLATRRTINFKLDYLPNEKGEELLGISTTRVPRGRDNLLRDREEAVRSLILAIGKSRKDRALRSEASRRLNYDAAVTAWACKKVWAEISLQGSAPNRIQYNRSHPMRDFIEAVFECLRIGCSVPAALDRIQDIGGDLALHLSVEEGY